MKRRAFLKSIAFAASSMLLPLTFTRDAEAAPTWNGRLIKLVIHRDTCKWKPLDLSGFEYDVIGMHEKTRIRAEGLDAEMQPKVEHYEIRLTNPTPTEEDVLKFKCEWDRVRAKAIG